MHYTKRVRAAGDNAITAPPSDGPLSVKLSAIWDIRLTSNLGCFVQTDPPFLTKHGLQRIRARRVTLKRDLRGTSELTQRALSFLTPYAVYGAWIATHASQLSL